MKKEEEEGKEVEKEVCVKNDGKNIRKQSRNSPAAHWCCVQQKLCFLVAKANSKQVRTSNILSCRRQNECRPAATTGKPKMARMKKTFVAISRLGISLEL